MSKTIVIKIGGAMLGSRDTTIEDIVALQQQGRALVVVHGGGKTITEWLEQRGLASRFVRGERVTDGAALEVVTSVLAGLVNKEIVADIVHRGGSAVGISGLDGGLVRSRVKDAELGYTGEVVRVDPAPLEALLGSGYIPVVAPVSLNVEGAAGGLGVLNVNADIVAGEIARAIDAEKLVFMTDVVGVCDQSGNLLMRLTPGEAEELVLSGVASGGMIPKIRACLSALSVAGVTRIIDGRQPHALLSEIEGGGGGTTIKRLSG